MSPTNHQYGNLISEIKSKICTNLKDSIADMFSETDIDLHKIAQSANSEEDQNRYFMLMRDTRALRENISNDFIDIFSRYLRPFAETATEKKKLNQDDEEDELSLVGQDEMDILVLLKSVTDSVSGKFSNSLSDLEARFEHLALQTPDIFYKNALHPSNIFQAFDDALGDHFDPADKKLLFNFFNNHVALKLGKTYDAINNLLVDAGILPKIKFHANKSTGGQAHNYAQPPPEDKQEYPEHHMNQGGYAMTSQPGQAYSSDSHGTSQTGMSGNGSSAGTPGTGQSARHDVAATGNLDKSIPGYQHITAGMPAQQIGEIVGGYLGGAPLAPPDPARSGVSTDLSAGGQFFPVSTGQYYGHQEILEALSNVQKNPVFSNAEDAHYDSEAIKQAVLSEIARTSGGTVTKSINKIAEKTIDFIELIFDAIIDDEEISDTIKTLLLRLQIPVIKASMLDQEFFIYDDHPARELLDKIAHAGIGVTDHHNEIYIKLDKIVITLVNEFELQADSFQIALDTLNAFLKEREAKALKKEEESQRQVLREHARNTVLKSLRTATRGKILPESIHALVLKRWPTLMYNHYLKQGKENDEWVIIIDTLRSIINSVQPLKNINDLDHLISTRDDLITTTYQYLQITNQSEEDIENVIQELINIHQSLIDNADFDETDTSTGRETENTVSSNQVSNDDLQPEENESPKLQLPSNIVPGMWFQVYNGDDKAQRRCKLSVVIIEDQKLVFVNYQGEIIVEKELGEFLDEIADGRSKVIMGHSVFDYALNSVVHELQSKH